MSVAFNEFLDLLNGGTVDDEKSLLPVFDGTAAIKARRDETREVSEVRAAVYKPQKYYRRNDAGEVSFYVAWTLFVAWADGKTSCWINAKDVLCGVGYETIHIAQILKKFISDKSQYPRWEKISKFILFYPHSEVYHSEAMWSGGNVGKEAANSVSKNTLFLTEHGVIELHQQAPKCRAFRNSITNFLLWIRSNLIPVNHVLISRERLDDLEERRRRANDAAAAATTTTTSVAAIADSLSAEKDRTIGQLRDSLEQAKREQAVQLESLRAELLAAQTRNIEEQQRLKLDYERASLRMQKQLEATTSEITDLYQHRSLLQDELNVLRDDVAERTAELRRVTDQLNATCEQLVALSAQTAELAAMANKKRTQLAQFRRGFRAMLKVYANPRNMSPLDDTFAIAKEPCVFFVHFGKLLLVNGNQWVDGFCVLRRQRRGLAAECKRMFSGYEAENGGTNYRVNSSYRTLGLLAHICSPQLARVDNFELPYGYQPRTFLMPHRDYKLNDNDRFLLLNTVNAVSFMNMIIDYAASDTTESSSSSSSSSSSGAATGSAAGATKRSRSSSALSLLFDDEDRVDGGERRVEEDNHHRGQMLYSRRRTERLNSDAAASSDDEDDGCCVHSEDEIDERYEYDEDNGDVKMRRPNDDDDNDDDAVTATPTRIAIEAKERTKALRTTTRLIKRIVEQNPALAVALTLKRYHRYRLPYDPTAGQLDRRLIDVDAMRDRLSVAQGTQTAATIFYSTNPGVTGAQILHAIFLLWQELVSSIEEESADSMQRDIDKLLNMFTDRLD